MEFVKQHKTIFVAISLVVSVAIILGTLFYNNQIYTQRVLDAIKREDVAHLKILLESPFGNLNSKPTLWIFEVLGERIEPTPLQAACKIGNLEIVELLLENGADVNYTYWDETRNQGSPLTNAASSLSNERLQIIKLLVESGADLNYRDSTGNDVLSCALFVHTECSDTIEVIEFLEKKGVNIYRVHPKNNNTLLHVACESDNFSAVQYLLAERSFDINAVNTDGETPLMYFLRFAGNRNKDTLQFLIESGADVGITNTNGKNAYDYAIEKHPEFVEILREAEIDPLR